MMEEMDAKRVALEREEAVRQAAGTRDHGMGAAALSEMRRAADAMAKLRVGGGQTVLTAVPTVTNTPSVPTDNARPVPPPSCRRPAAARRCIR